MRLLHPSPDNVIAPCVDLKHFNYNLLTRCFVVDASQLQGQRFIDRLYKDATDQGLVLVNPKTGQGVPFVLTRTDGEVEIMGWHFEVVSETVLKYPSLSSLRILIVNT